MARHCDYCLKDLSFFDSFRSFFGTQRCGICIHMLARQIDGLARYSQELYQRRAIDYQEYNKLYATLQRLPPDVSGKVLGDLKRWAYICQIYHGDLNIVHSGILLSPGEEPYFEIGCSLRKEMKRQTLAILGRLLITDRKVYFISNGAKDSFAIEVSNLASTCILGSELQIFTKKAKGGTFLVHDPELLDAFIHAVVERWNRRLFGMQEQKRSIPEPLRLQVLAHYHNRCAACGADGEGAGVGLEIDHIFPWSKGGKTEFSNLQPLCGPCNKKKSNRF